MSKSVSVVHVTPSLAALWLSMSHGNRALSAAYVAEHAAALRKAYAEGRTDGLFSPDAITINTSGALVNGHHRLTAIVRTGVATDMCVCTGMPDEMVSRIDSGRQRTVAHHALFAGADVALHRRASEMLRGLRVIADSSSGGGGAWRRVTYADVTAFVAAGGEDLALAAQYSRARFPAFAAGALYYVRPISAAVVDRIVVDSVQPVPETMYGETMAGVMRECRTIARGLDRAAIGKAATKIFGVVRHAMHGTAVTAPKPWPGAIAWVDAMRATVGKGTLRQLLAGEKIEGDIE